MSITFDNAVVRGKRVSKMPLTKEKKSCGATTNITYVTESILATSRFALFFFDSVLSVAVGISFDLANNSMQWFILQLF